MRKGWRIMNLEEVCEKIFAGGDKPKNDFSSNKTNDFTIPIYANGEKNKGLYGYTSKAKVSKPSITVSARGTIGYSEIRTEPFYPIVRLIVLIPNSEIVDIKFLKYVVGNMNFKNSGTSIPQLTVPMIKKYKSVIPPLKEQKQIVAILDKAFEAIDQAKVNIEKNITNAQELFQSKLNEIFSQKGDGWVEKRLVNICEIKPQKKIAKEKLDETDLVSFVPMKFLGVDQKYFNSDQVKTLKKAYSGYVYFEENDVILAKITPCFENGKLGIARNLKNGVGFGSSEFLVFRTNNALLPDYLYYFLNRDTFRLKGENLMSGAVGHKRIQPNFYENEVIRFPSLQNQTSICQSIDNIQEVLDSIKESYQQKLTNLEELKKSILEKAFAGELTAKYKPII